MADVEVTEHVAADPGTVWGLLSDVTRMGQWSPETTSCHWLRGATGPPSERASWAPTGTACAAGAPGAP